MTVNDGLVASNGAMLTVSGGKLYAGTHETNVQHAESYQLLEFIAWQKTETHGRQFRRKCNRLMNRMYSVDKLAVSGKTFYVSLHRWGDGARGFTVGESEKTLWTELSPQDFSRWEALARVR